MFVYYSVHKVPRWAYDSRSGNWYCWWLSHVPVFHELVIWGARSEKGGMAQGVGWGNSVVQFVTLDSPPSLFFLIHRWNMKYRLCGRFESTCFTIQLIMKYSYWIQHKCCLYRSWQRNWRSPKSWSENLVSQPGVNFRVTLLKESRMWKRQPRE